MEATSIECGTKQLVFQHVEAMKGKKKININQVKWIRSMNLNFIEFPSIFSGEMKINKAATKCNWI